MLPVFNHSQSETKYHYMLLQLENKASGFLKRPALKAQWAFMSLPPDRFPLLSLKRLFWTHYIQEHTEDPSPVSDLPALSLILICYAIYR